MQIDTQQIQTPQGFYKYNIYIIKKPKKNKNRLKVEGLSFEIPITLKIIQKQEQGLGKIMLKKNKVMFFEETKKAFNWNKQRKMIQSKTMKMRQIYSKKHLNRSNKN
ncbi:hypothetical protein IMG5_105030 [Ichthyophthirius multifiliis]|uniref:Uncharacterized protein n=1 Tax=Ichthyophthirius multifiliis TaxID=5932 RepID=G0QT01_ICHMU|nr:hypothetical protein IMG5_105030 [Ichthyophthirius multifiliis]EGR31654.1 hypothetical protein IMG5_105030 [Ichthyophthirius multifiliis]|eukprot:XP_004035140.1 hypothetical protein IMG5_105030 [Ichthyophthirius multifiliis]